MANRFIHDKLLQEASASQPTLITRQLSLSTNSVEDGMKPENTRLSESPNTSKEEQAINTLLQIVEKPEVFKKLKRVRAILFEHVGDVKEVISSYLSESTTDVGFATSIYC